MLIGKSVLHARITELELKHFSLWITMLLDNTMLLVLTAYTRPQSNDHKQKLVN